MAGDSPQGKGGKAKNKKPLHVGPSTPAHQDQGALAKTKFAAHAKYEVNVRSFHPNKQFEKEGFRFHGDNRGFSLGDSWYDPDDKNIQNLPTSRIWQRYVLDTNLNKSGDLSEDISVELETESNMSKPGPNVWRYFGHEEHYEKKELKPKGNLRATSVTAPHGAQKTLRLVSQYGGINHAFLMSDYLQKNLSLSHVPTLDVFHEIFVRIARVSLYMDIVSLTYGDGFPNCEAFIKDAVGQKLFLGTHVRIGYPATHLWTEQNRLMWANAIRVEIDQHGNFGEKLWVFGQVLGGPSLHRDVYPTVKWLEACSPTAREPLIQKSAAANAIIWNCGHPNSILQKDSLLPLRLSALRTSKDELRGLMDATWAAGPKLKITRTQWNNQHLHQNPNGGRTNDYYDLAEEKWNRLEP